MSIKHAKEKKRGVNHEIVNISQQMLKFQREQNVQTAYFF